MPTLKNDVTGSNQIAIVGTSKHHHGVAGESKDDGAGVLGVSSSGEGVSGFSKTGHGVVISKPEITLVTEHGKRQAPGTDVSLDGDGIPLFPITPSAPTFAIRSRSGIHGPSSGT